MWIVYYMLCTVIAYELQVFMKLRFDEYTCIIHAFLVCSFVQPCLCLTKCCSKTCKTCIHVFQFLNGIFIAHLSFCMIYMWHKLYCMPFLQAWTFCYRWLEVMGAYRIVGLAAHSYIYNHIKFEAHCRHGKKCRVTCFMYMYLYPVIILSRERCFTCYWKLSFIHGALL